MLLYFLTFVSLLLSTQAITLHPKCPESVNNLWLDWDSQNHTIVDVKCYFDHVLKAGAIEVIYNNAAEVDAKLIYLANKDSKITDIGSVYYPGYLSVQDQRFCAIGIRRLVQDSTGYLCNWS